MEFDNSQREALNQMKTGCILCGGVGSGKSRTAIAYYFSKECGGSFEPSYSPMKNPKDLYIITTAKKRDSLEWESELAPFLLTPDSDDITIVIDSWNSINKYRSVTNSFFIFDEQRLVGSGAWVQAFYKITGSGRYREKPTGNNWILLSATPGDTWSDYIPVFVANKFYKNKQEFLLRHAVYNRYSKFPKIDKYLEERRLTRLRDSILVDIHIERQTVRHYLKVPVEYDREAFREVMKNRVDIFNENEFIENTPYFFFVIKRVVNQNINRVIEIEKIIKDHPKVIIFYNFDYELEMLRQMCKDNDYTYSEWNGHKHENLPTGDSWVYLVNYSSGAEGWNCITTDTMIFFSLNYSYRTTEQAAGRIDRRNTPYKDLYYYQIYTNSWIDRAIKATLSCKKTFNERKHISKIPHAQKSDHIMKER